MNALAYLGFVDLHDVERMTLVEYSLRMEAYQLQQLQVRQNIAIQAWFNQTVQATVGKKNPRPKFKKFDQFFDRMEQELVEMKQQMAYVFRGVGKIEGTAKDDGTDGNGQAWKAEDAGTGSEDVTTDTPATNSSDPGTPK